MSKICGVDPAARTTWMSQDHHRRLWATCQQWNRSSSMSWLPFCKYRCLNSSIARLYDFRSSFPPLATLREAPYSFLAKRYGFKPRRCSNWKTLCIESASIFNKIKQDNPDITILGSIPPFFPSYTYIPIDLCLSLCICIHIYVYIDI